MKQLLIGVPCEPFRVEAEHQLVRRIGPPHPPVEPGHREQVGGEVEQQRPGMLVGKLLHLIRDVSSGRAQRSLFLFGDDSEIAIRWVFVERPVRHLGLIK